MERKRNSTAWQHPSKWRSRSSSRSRSSTLQNSAIGMETSRSTWPSIGKQRSHHNNTERVPKQWMRTHASRFSFRWNLTGEIHTPTPTPSVGVQSPTKVVWTMYILYDTRKFSFRWNLTGEIRGDNNSGFKSRKINAATEAKDGHVIQKLGASWPERKQHLGWTIYDDLVSEWVIWPTYTPSMHGIPYYRISALIPTSDLSTLSAKRNKNARPKRKRKRSPNRMESHKKRRRRRQCPSHTLQFEDILIDGKSRNREKGWWGEASRAEPAEIWVGVGAKSVCYLDRKDLLNTTIWCLFCRHQSIVYKDIYFAGKGTGTGKTNNIGAPQNCSGRFVSYKAE